LSATALIARHEWRRLAVQPFAWMLAAIVVALMAWQYLLSLETFLQLAPKIGGLREAPGVTDLVAIPLLRSFSNLLMLVVPLVTMRTIAGERRSGALALLLAGGTEGNFGLGKEAAPDGLLPPIVPLEPAVTTTGA